MGLSEALYSSVTGLQVHQTKLDVIGNNIANVNTIGFKAGTVTFEDQLSQTLRASASPTAGIGGQNPTQIGLGVALGAINTLQTQGTLQSTGNATDMAIQGNGFFLVSNGTGTSYTRDGSFNLDSSGVLVNPANGLKLLGYVADSNGVVDTSKQVNSSSVLKVPIGSLTSVKKTSQATFGGNLNAGAALQSTKVTISGELDYSQSPGTITSSVYDANGNAHTVAAQFGAETHYSGAPPAGAPAGAIAETDVTLNIDGVAQRPQHLYTVPVNGVNTFVFADAGGNNLGSSLTTTITGSVGTPNFPVQIDFSGLQASSNVSVGADGQSVPTPIQSSQIGVTGNINLDGSFPITKTTNVYSNINGVLQAYQVTTVISNPTVSNGSLGTPTGAKEQFDVKVSFDTIPPSGTQTTLYDSANNAGSPLYYVPGSGFVLADSNGNALGSSLTLTGGALPGAGTAQGKQIAANFPLTVDLSGLTTTSVAGSSDGQAGPSPVSNNSLDVFDSLGVKHSVNIKFERTLVGTNAPAASAARWSWTATENGTVVGSSESPGNSPLYFDNQGNLLDTNKQSLTITPTGGAAPFSVSLDYSTLTQVDGDSSVTAGEQDGFPVGTLQSFSVSDAGLITGIFSNGQTRVLGQIATASFSNPEGLEKEGQNLFKESSNSGLAQVGLPNLSGRGQITTGFVEQSNVDLSSEFTDLIVTQRGFEANTKIITVVDQLLQAVINLKQ